MYSPTERYFWKQSCALEPEMNGIGSGALGSVLGLQGKAGPVATGWSDSDSNSEALGEEAQKGHRS